MGATLTRATAPIDETSIATAFARDGLTPARWSNAPGDAYSQHTHTYHKVLFCLSGSITFQLVASAESIKLRPGDRLDITPNTRHNAVVGPEGVTCIEAAIPPSDRSRARSR